MLSNNANQRRKLAKQNKRKKKPWAVLVRGHRAGPVVFGDTPPEDIHHDHGQEGEQGFE